jgi:hypothetical protein
MKCGFCGGRVIRDEDNWAWMHAQPGERVRVAPGDYVSAEHNRAGTTVLNVDVIEDGGEPLVSEGWGRDV